MTQYSESDLVIPALLFIKYNPGATTTELKKHLITLLHPIGRDATLLPGTGDSRFTQKIRNLKSHNTLEKHNWVRYQRIPGNGVWRLTQSDSQYLQEKGY